MLIIRYEIDHLTHNSKRRVTITSFMVPILLKESIKFGHRQIRLVIQTIVIDKLTINLSCKSIYLKRAYQVVKMREHYGVQFPIGGVLDSAQSIGYCILLRWDPRCLKRYLLTSTQHQYVLQDLHKLRSSCAELPDQIICYLTIRDYGHHFLTKNLLKATESLINCLHF